MWYLTGNGTVLDYADFYGIATHIFSVAEINNNYIISDWEKQTVNFVKTFEVEPLISHMYRPSQIYLQQLFTYQGKHKVQICFLMTNYILV